MIGAFVEGVKNLFLKLCMLIGIVLVVAVVFFILNVLREENDRKAVLRQSLHRAQIAQKKEEATQKTIKFFTAHKPEILAEIQVAIDQKDFQKALKIGGKYRHAKYDGLAELYKKAKFAERAEKIKAETAQLLAELKTIPANQYDENIKRYQRLAQLHPNNSRYKTKHEFYRNKKIADARKVALVKKRKERIETQFSVWDGSHTALERYIKSTMNDPDSYQHVETRYADRGDYLIVKTTFRGKNAFGGMVVNWVKAKVDLDGNILGIIEAYP